MVAPVPPAAVGIGPNPHAGPRVGPPPIDHGNSSGTPLWGEDGFTFGDLVDLVNPLQHIPIVSWAYRAITGDQIAPAAMAMGGGMFGGAAGLAAGLLEAVIQGTTGKDAGARMLAMFQDDGDPLEPPPAFAVAEAIPADGIPAFSQEQIDLVFASFDAGSPTTIPGPGRSQLEDPAAMLDAGETALLLAIRCSAGICPAGGSDTSGPSQECRSHRRFRGAGVHR